MSSLEGGGMRLYERLAASVRAKIPVARATILSGPLPPGAQMLVFLDGTRDGSLGLASLDDRVAGEARELLRYDRAETRTYPVEASDMGWNAPQQDNVVRVFIEPHVPPPILVIVGAGHTSIPLSAFARIAGFHVVLIDARAAFAAPERFPEVDEIIVEWPHKALAERPITSSTYIAVLTHDAKFEEPLLPLLLRSPARYIGVIGSKRTQLQRRERLRAEGFDEAAIARLSGPIGLDLGAVTPEEIALSILAEIVAKQHGRSGGFLSEKLVAATS